MHDINAANSLIISKEAANVSKGIPVPYTGFQRRYKFYAGNGVSSNSRSVAQPFYADDSAWMGGKSQRREIRRKERAQWMAEWQEEQNENEEYGYAVEEYDVSGWFSESLVCPEDYEDMMDMWQNSPCGCRD